MMHNHPALDRLSLPPPSVLEQRRKAQRRDVSYIFTPMAFVISVIVAMLSIAIMVTLIATAPQIVAFPLAVTVAVGLLASPFLGRARRWLTRKNGIRAGLAAGGLAILLVGFTIPEAVRVALVATAFAGLMAVRVAALYRGWDPRAAARATRHVVDTSTNAM